MKNNESSSINEMDEEADNNTMYSKTEKNIDIILDENSTLNIDYERSKEEKEENNNEKLDSISEIKNMKFKRLDYLDIFQCGMKIRYNCNTYFELIKNK